MTVFHIHFPARTVVLATTEAAVVVLTLILASFATFGPDAGLMLTYRQVLVNMVIASSACMLCMYYFDLYESVVLRSLGSNLTRLVQVLGAACLVLALVYYAFPVARLGHELFLLWVTLAGLSLALWRTAFLALMRVPRFHQRVVFVGPSPLRSTIVTELMRRPELGATVLGYLDDEQSPNNCIAQVRRVGCVADLPSVVSNYKLHEVVIGDPSLLTPDLVAGLRRRGVLIRTADDLYEGIFDKVPLETLNANAFFNAGKLSTVTVLAKRSVDVITSCIGLLFAAPLMLAAAIAIWLDSPGPIIFRQKRIGRGGEVFTLFKFRSMFDGADKDGIARAAQRNDSRCTRVGRFLRRSRIDELPQLYNILRGDMCLVGPRPFTVNMEEDLAARIPHYTKRWLVRPGVTGWAQVRRAYCSSLEDNIDKLRYDLFYIKHASLGMDLLIWCETVKILLLGRGGQ